MEALLDWLRGDEARQWIQLGSLLLARALPLLVFSPAFGGDLLPARLRVVFAVALGSSFFFAFQPGFAVLSASAWLVLILKEALIGFGLAIAARICFQIVASVGAYFDLARGATLANLLDPLTHAQTPVLGTFLSQTFLALCFTAGGFGFVLDALARSYETYPMTASLPESALGAQATERWLHLFSSSFVLALELAAPAFALLALLDLTLGLAQRFAGRLNVFALGLAVRAWLGVGVLALAVGIVFSDSWAWLRDVLGTTPF
jgi:flagellar biosynthetic protein FliR